MDTSRETESNVDLKAYAFERNNYKISEIVIKFAYLKRETAKWFNGNVYLFKSDGTLEG